MDVNNAPCELSKIVIQKTCLNEIKIKKEIAADSMEYFESWLYRLFHPKVLTISIIGIRFD